MTDEEFGGDVELTEEMQAQLLEDYQRECEELGNSSKSDKSGKVNKLDSSDSADVSKDSVAKDSSSSSTSGTNSSSTEKSLLEELKVDLNKTTEVASKPSPSSTGKPRLIPSRS